MGTLKKSPIFAVVLISLFANLAEGAAGLTYHGRLFKPNGQPADGASVQFRIQVRTPGTTNCLLYQETQIKDLRGTAGVFNITLNDGSAIVPNTEPFSLTQAFQNRGEFTFSPGKCSGDDEYIPSATDGRVLSVSFNDGSGWEHLPAQQINFVPMALEAVRVGGYRPNQFFRLEEGGSPQTMDAWSRTDYDKLVGIVSGTENILGAASGFTGPLVGDVIGSQGATSVVGLQGNPVSSVAPLNDQILKWNGSAWAPANPDAASGSPDWSEITNKPTSFAPGGSAGGDLSGTYPSPVIANNAVSGAKIADGGIPFSKIAPGSAVGQVIRYSGTDWAATRLNYQDLVNDVGASPWPGSCGMGQFVTWLSASDVFSCVDITSTMITAALGYTPLQTSDLSNLVPSGRTITAGTGLTGGGDLSVDRSLNVDVGTGANQIPQLDATGKLSLAVLPDGVVGEGTVTNISTGTGLTGGPITETGTISIADLGVGTAQLADGAVTNAKINSVAVSKVTSGSGLYLTYQPDGNACAVGQVLKWNNARWECADDEDSTSAETDPTVAAFAKNAPSADFATPAGVLTLGTVPVSKGGTGAITQSAAINNLLPPQGTHAGKVLQTDGANVSWEDAAATGVTSVGVSVPSYMSSTGGPITNSGTIALGFGSQAESAVFAGPAAGSGAPGFRNLVMADIKGDSVGNPAFWNISGACTAGQMPTYSSVTDQVTCAAYAITSGQVTGALGYTPADAGDFVAKSGDTMTGALNLPANGLVVGSDQLAISGGMVGIGTTDPSATVHVAGNDVELIVGGDSIGAGYVFPPSVGLRTDSVSGTSALTQESKVGDFEIAGGIRWSNWDDDFNLSEIASFQVEVGNGVNTGSLFLSTAGSDGLNERLRISTAGNVGIGTSSPSERLDVSGKVRATEFCIAGDCIDAWPSGGGGGSVTGVTGAANQIAVDNTDPAEPVLSLADLAVSPAGSYGSTTHVPAITVDEKGRVTAVSNTNIDLSPAGKTLATNQVWVGNSSSEATARYFGAGDLRNSTGAAQIPGSCAASQTLTWSSITDVFNCTNISITMSQVSDAPTLGTAAAKNFGVAAGNLVELDGAARIPASLLPTTAVTTATGFAQDGNIFGAAATLGTNDNHALNFETNATTKMTILPNGNVGIGTATPASSLHVDNGGLLMTGSTGATPVSGAGVRLMWVPAKKAFRGGETSGTAWDAANIGEHTIAFGFDAEASGWGSVALGSGTIASGASSVALGSWGVEASGDGSLAVGSGAEASGENAVALGLATMSSGSGSFSVGNSTLASGDHSVAMGMGSISSGDQSTALGYNTTAESLAQVTVGRHNLPKGGENPSTWVATDPLFVVGNGTGSGASRSTALMVLKNGNVGIGTSSPRSALDVVGAITGRASVNNASSTVDFAQGNIQHSNSDCGSFALWNLKDGGSYMFIVKGTTSATCAFTAYSDNGMSTLTVRLPPQHGATEAGKHTIYNLAVSGGDVYFAWTPGY